MKKFSLLFPVLSFLFNVQCIVEAARPDGICSTFLKKRELMAGDSWSSKPLSASDAVKNLSKYDAIWCAQLISLHNPNAWQLLNKQPDKPILLHYLSGDTAMAGSDSEYTCLDYKYINTHHPEWFLLADTRNATATDHTMPDKRIRWDPVNKNRQYYNRFFIDVGNKEFQKWAAQEIVELVSGRKENIPYGYSGLAMDNVALRALEKLLTKSYPNWKYAGRTDLWNKAYFEYIKTVHDALKAKGYILVVNHTTDYGSNIDGDDWETIMGISDGLMDEYALGVPKNVWGDSRWLWTVKHHEDTVAKGLSAWWVCYPSKDGKEGYEQFLYTYCTFLLTKKPGKSFYFSTKGISGYGNPEVPWYAEYDLPIGKPLSARYSQNNCWTRDYENAKIIVNPTGKSEKVVIDKDKYWLDWASKTKVSEAEIPPKGGRIFLPTPYTITKDAAN